MGFERAAFFLVIFAIIGKDTATCQTKSFSLLCKSIPVPSINHLFRFFVEFFKPLPESLVSTKSTFETDGRLLINIL